MRKLVFKDAMKMARIIKKGNLKDELSKIAEKAKGKTTNEFKLGIDVVMSALEACGSEEVEKEIYSLLGDIFEEQNVENLSLEALRDKFIQLVKENDLTSFFKSASL